MLPIILTILAAVITAEFLGYALHMLLHSNKIKFLSRNHMIHHLLIYGPKQEQQTEHYLTAIIDGRPSVGNIGLEWLLPGLILIAMIGGALWLLQIPFYLSLLFMGTALLWDFVMFNYMHDAMHLKNFWMIKDPRASKWFLAVREKHVIHHLQVRDDGRLMTNFGICFFFFDRLFGTYQEKEKPINEKGYKKAQELYSFVFDKK